MSKTGYSIRHCSVKHRDPSTGEPYLCKYWYVNKNSFTLGVLFPSWASALAYVIRRTGRPNTSFPLGA